MAFHAVPRLLPPVSLRALKSASAPRTRPSIPQRSVPRAKSPNATIGGKRPICTPASPTTTLRAPNAGTSRAVRANFEGAFWVSSMGLLGRG